MYHIPDKNLVLNLESDDSDLDLDLEAQSTEQEKKTDAATLTPACTRQVLGSEELSDSFQKGEKSKLTAGVDGSDKTTVTPRLSKLSVNENLPVTPSPVKLHRSVTSSAGACGGPGDNGNYNLKEVVRNGKNCLHCYHL